MGQRLFSVALIALGVVAAWQYFSLPNPASLSLSAVSTGGKIEVLQLRAKHSMVKQSALIQRRLSQNPELEIQQIFVPLEQISPQLRRAVVLGEDARFWKHRGIDWIELKAAAMQAVEARRLGRGASTISQQLARTLYLSPERKISRKVREWIIARRLEASLDKHRILELYLNHAEWGEGIFGAEAAARSYFGKSAASIDAAEAAILTAILPAPRSRHPQLPSPAFRRRAQHVAGLLAGKDDALREEIRQRVDRILAGG